MRSIFDSKRFSSLGLSFAGRGLPERLRTTAFAFLGLTAAAGLIVVAMLAQAGLPLLSPAPLPSGPAQEASVGEAVTLGRTATVTPHLRPAADAEGSRTSSEQGGDPAPSDAGESVPAAVESPAPVPAPETGGEGGDGRDSGGKPKDSSPAAATPPAESPASPPASAPEPEATPSSTTPSGPGNSSSPAAAEHASERGIEASSSHLDSANGRGNAAAVPDRGQ